MQGAGGFKKCGVPEVSKKIINTIMKTNACIFRKISKELKNVFRPGGS